MIPASIGCRRDVVLAGINLTSTFVNPGKQSSEPLHEKLSSNNKIFQARRFNHSKIIVIVIHELLFDA